MTKAPLYGGLECGQHTNELLTGFELFLANIISFAVIINVLDGEGMILYVEFFLIIFFLQKSDPFHVAT